MQRRLIQLSPSTAVVSLPASWVRTNRLKKGHALFVEINENRVLVSAASSKAGRETAVDVSGLPDRLFWAAIDAAYIAGYDTITIRTSGATQTALLSKAVRYFPGMIIEDERERLVRFQDIANEQAVELSKTIRRIFQLIRIVHEDGCAAHGAVERAAVKKIDYTVNSYVSLAQRGINKYGYEPFSKSGILHTLLKTLELFSDKLAAIHVAGGRHDHLAEIMAVFSDLERLHFSYAQDALVALEQKRKRVKTKTSVEKELLSLLYDLEELEMQLHS